MKKYGKKFLALLLALALVCSLMVAAIATGSNDIGNETEVKSESEIETKKTKLSAEKEFTAENEADEEVTESEKEGEPTDEAEIEIADFEGETEPSSDVDVPDAEETDEDYDITLPDETSDSEESEDVEWITLTDGGELSAGYYRLERDVTMTVDITIPYYTEVTIDLAGHALKGTGTASAITNNGTFTLEDSSGNDSGTLTGPTNLEYSVNGGGVYNTGTFTMNGGTICNNKVSWFGAGVNSYGTFIMNGGSISGNTTGFYGGGVYSSGTFTMNNGSISDNTANYGGGVYSDGGTFTMSGGTISDNTSNSSGGVYNGGTFTMSGGTISSNTTRDDGGGVYNNGGTFTMNDGTISDNTADWSGGGVYNSGTFTIDGGSITGNTAGDVDNLHSDCYGGGIYKTADSSMYVSGIAIISGNKAGKRNNDWWNSDSYYVTENIYLNLSSEDDYPIRSYIQLDGPLTEGASIGVTTSIASSEGNPVQITGAESDTNYYASSAQYFFSDEGYGVRANTSEGYVELYGDKPESNDEEDWKERGTEEHNLVITGWEWSEDYSSCIAILTCIDEDCDFEECWHATVEVIETEATCTEPGERVLIASIDVEGAAIYSDTVTFEIEALEHDWIEEIEPADYENDGSITWICSRCGEVAYTEVIERLEPDFDDENVSATGDEGDAATELDNENENTAPNSPEGTDEKGTESDSVGTGGIGSGDQTDSTKNNSSTGATGKIEYNEDNGKETNAVVVSGSESEDEGKVVCYCYHKMTKTCSD